MLGFCVTATIKLTGLAATFSCHKVKQILIFSKIPPPPKKKSPNATFSPHIPLCPSQLTAAQRLLAAHSFLQIKRPLMEICADWTFLYTPWSVRATKSLKCLKQMELMGCNYAPLSGLFWFYTQALVSATSAGSHGTLSFRSSGRVLAWL